MQQTQKQYSAEINRINLNEIRQKKIGRESVTIACFWQSQRQAGAWDTLEGKREGFRCSLIGGCGRGEAGGR